MATTKQTQKGKKAETADDKKAKLLDLARQKYILQVKEYVDDYVNLNAFQLVHQNVSNNTVVKFESKPANDWIKVKSLDDDESSDQAKVDTKRTLFVNMTKALGESKSKLIQASRQLMSVQDIEVNDELLKSIGDEVENIKNAMDSDASFGKKMEFVCGALVELDNLYKDLMDVKVYWCTEKLDPKLAKLIRDCKIPDTYDLRKPGDKKWMTLLESGGEYNGIRLGKEFTKHTAVKSRGKKKDTSTFRQRYKSLIALKEKNPKKCKYGIS